MQVVDKKCHNKLLWGSVAAQDKTGCFTGCGGLLNTTDPCNIRCFFETVLGPDAGKAGGAVTGMPLPDLIAAWDLPFSPESAGGCPALPGV